MVGRLSARLLPMLRGEIGRCGTMISDIERREVAARLREIQSDVIPGTKTEVHPIAGRIIGVACGYELPDFQGLLGRLADLIEPNHFADDSKKVDRDALLELADEMDRDGKMQRERQKAGEHWFIDGLDVMEYARRIREALGVES